MSRTRESYLAAIRCRLNRSIVIKQTATAKVCSIDLHFVQLEVLCLARQPVEIFIATSYVKMRHD